MTIAGIRSARQTPSPGVLSMVAKTSVIFRSRVAVRMGVEPETWEKLSRVMSHSLAPAFLRGTTPFAPPS